GHAVARRGDTVYYPGVDVTVARGIGGRFRERVIGVAARHELYGHISHDVPAPAEIAQGHGGRCGAVLATKGFEEAERHLENALLGAVAALGRARGLDPVHGCEARMVFASGAGVGRL